MKNFLLVNAPANRPEPFLLLGLSPETSDNEREFKPFSQYCRHLKQRRGYSQATIESYSGHVARFIDYVFEASLTKYAKTNTIGIEDLIYSYETFLIHRKNSEHPLSNELAHRLGKDRPTSMVSISQSIEAAIRLYLDVSSTRAEMGEIDPLFSRLLAKDPEYRSASEISKIKANSWLAGMIRGGISRAIPKKGKLFAGVARRTKQIEKSPFKTKPFPIEHTVSLLRVEKPRKAKCYHRDMAIYSVLLASGCRVHEALQLRMQDILIDSDGDEIIELHSPFERSAPGLTSSEMEKLSWKGRQTPTTFLLHPFADIFWEHLQNYLNKEYNSSVNHDFVFQKLNGRPLFTARRKELNATFRQYAAKAGLDDLTGIRRHSLRHTYGTYVLNYMPVPGNATPGLPMPYVQIIMGHASISSTEKYAKHDEEIVNAYIQHSNNFLKQHSETSIESARLFFHQKQIVKIQSLAKRMNGGEAK